MITFETLSKRLAEAQNFAQIDTPGYKQEEVEVETLSEKVADLKVKKLLDTLGDRLAEMQVDTTH